MLREVLVAPEDHEFMARWTFKRTKFRRWNRLRYDREQALQSVTILSHRSNLVSNSYPSDGPRGRRCAPRGAWSAGESSAGASRAHVLRDLLRHTLGCPVRLGTPLDIRVHGALDLRETKFRRWIACSAHVLRARGPRWTGDRITFLSFCGERKQAVRARAQAPSLPRSRPR